MNRVSDNGLDRPFTVRKERYISDRTPDFGPASRHNPVLLNIRSWPRDLVYCLLPIKCCNSPVHSPRYRSSLRVNITPERVRMAELGVIVGHGSWLTQLELVLKASDVI